MAKKVFVTSAQKSAARIAVKRSVTTGRPVASAVRKIAVAKAPQVTQGRTVTSR